MSLTQRAEKGSEAAGTSARFLAIFLGFWAGGGRPSVGDLHLER